MGNSASSAANAQRPSTITRSPDLPISLPAPTDPSLRQKKRSLELPDLASLSSLGRPKQPSAKPAPIPIPVSPINNTATPGEAGRIRAPIALPSTADVLSTVEPTTHRPFPPPAHRQNQNRTSAPPDHRQVAAQQRIQDLYNHWQSPSPPPQHRAFTPETVRSSIPIGFHFVDESPSRAFNDPLPELVAVKITWRGPGKVVQLARAGDDDWQGRTLMERESPNSMVHHVTVALQPGTHHIRFLIDDQWLVADDYPTAVDDQGTLANYVSVPISYSPPTATAIPASVSQKPKMGHSFWSAASSADDDSQDTPPSSMQRQTHVHQHHASHQSHASINERWTSEIPPELVNAAAEEERYVEASTGRLDSSHHTVINGFIPAPNIPPAPSLPRHLDKLILNSRVVIGGTAPASGTSTLVGTGATGRSSRGVSGREGRHSTAAPAGRVKTTRDPVRDRRDRDRDGGRGRERRSGSDTQPPPPPPPSEVDEEVTGGTSSTPIPPAIDSLGTPTGIPSTPRQGSSIPEPPPASVSAAITPGMSSAPQTPTIPASTSTASRLLTLGLDSQSEQTLTDDGSVLPVPSHVVLHHLSTSAIKNGVLAVADSTRYKKKYLTTIYYKPTAL